MLLASEEWAAKRGIPVQAYLTLGRTAAVDFVAGEGLLMAPTVAVSDLLKESGLSLQDFDYYEIHEAFAAQVLATLKAWESDEYCRTRLGRTSRSGPSTGQSSTSKARASPSAILLPPLARASWRCWLSCCILKAAERGLISVCTAGGMGVAAILEGVGTPEVNGQGRISGR